MEKVVFVSENEIMNKPNGDGLYKIILEDGNIEYAVIIGEGEYTRIKSLKALWDSEPIHHPFYRNAKYLGPLTTEK